MVMHARKIPRISDGFSEKHHSHSHGYENSKYSSSKYRYGNHEKSRDSPSANSLRSSSPDSHSQSPHYHKILSGNYYKIREKERDRDREREYKEYRDRDNSRSPKDRRRDTRERDRDHRDSRGHDRVNSSHKKDEKERVLRVGDWSEHVSSSGKKYYYNCRTEVSQWEKPPEWLESERGHRASNQGHLALKDNNIHRGHDKRPDKHSSLGDGYRDIREAKELERDKREHRNDYHYERRDIRKFSHEVGATDMEISSGDSTPTSERHSRATSDTLQEMASSSHQINSVGRGSKLCSIGGSLPGIVSCSVPGNSTESMNSIANSPLINSSVSQLLNSHSRVLSNQCESKNHLSSLNILTNTNSINNIDDGLASKFNRSIEPLNISSNTCGAGPPTPTHSENQDGLDIRKIGSPNSSLNSLQSLVHQHTSNIPSLTPSLRNYYNESLISHVQGWPADVLEKQCQRAFEEAHTMSSLIMTKVSADLKMARSLVRLAEIQATLLEQRILFLRAQKQALEDINTKNCFMSDT